MSGNQKQSGAGGPPTHRYTTVPYQPVPTPQSRTDGYHISNQAYVQASNQVTQGTNVRGIPQNPPNQSSTPPSNDLQKVGGSVPQQPSMNHIYSLSASGIRGAQPGYYRPGVGASSAASNNRMPTRQPQNQPIFSAPGNPQFMPSIGTMQQMYMAQPAAMSNFYPSQRPPYNVQPGAPNIMYGGQMSYSYATTPPQQGSVAYSFFPMNLPRPSQPQNNSASQGTVPQPMQTIALQPQPVTSQPSFNTQPQPQVRNTKQRRSKAIPIIDPATGVDRLTEVLEQDMAMSGESSSRQTPQPSHQTAEEAKVVQADFAKKVAQAINIDLPVGCDAQGDPVHLSPLPLESVDQVQFSSQAPNPARLESLVQTSNLKVQAKEFILPVNVSKETTPIVSANCDAVEVTLPNKQPKDKESPGKVKKPPTLREHKDSASSSKESTAKDAHVGRDKSPSIPLASQVQSPQEVVSALPVFPIPPKETSSPSSSQPRDDKKNVRKDVKIESKVPNEVIGSVAVPPPVPVSQPNQENITSMNAKSKSAQRSRDSQKNTPQQIQKVNVVVPPPQPAKANNKSSKKSEINLKGANKEGTDMDAFTDVANSDTVNANVVGASSAEVEAIVNNDIVNANSIIIINNNNTKSDIKETVVTKEPCKKEIIEVQTIKPDTKTLTKNNYDITSIVKDAPAPLLSFNYGVEVRDETDRATTLSNEQLVQAKNEANSKTSDANSSCLLAKYDFPAIQADQWTPVNQDGKLRYHLEFLHALKALPLSNVLPNASIPESIKCNPAERRLLDAVKDGNRNNPGERFSLNRDFTPPFSYAGKSSSQRGPPPKRGSQSGKSGSSSGGKSSSKQGIVMQKVSISLREDVKLHEAENAWKPSFKGPEINIDDEELKKKLRGILNKLTPEKFGTLCEQVRGLKINSEERLKDAINLLFEKAVDEPNYSEAYARLCNELALVQVPTKESTPEKPDYVKFKKLLVTRCQKEFEKNGLDECEIRKKMQSDIDACDDPERKKELQFNLEEHERKLRLKSVGNIRFIGELFKKGMLTAKIMRRCLEILIKNRDEESLECLCKLMTTVGKELEEKHASEVTLDDLFDTMDHIVQRRELSSRVRFMLQDVLDLRKNKWIARRQENAPKTIDQIQKDHENEQLTSHLNSMSSGTPRKDDRGSSGHNDRKQRRNITDDGGWTTRATGRTVQFTVQSDKLKTKMPQMDEPLGSSQVFSSWGRGSNIKTPQNNLLTNTTNMYAALEHVETEKRFNSKPNRDPYNSKGSSMERSYKHNYEGRGSRSRSNDNTSAGHRSLPMPSIAPAFSSQTKTSQPGLLGDEQEPASTPATTSSDVSVETLTDVQLKQLKRRMRNNLEEFLSDSLSAAEYEQDTLACVPTTRHVQLVSDGYLHVIENTRNFRIKTGLLFSYMIKVKAITLEDYCEGLSIILDHGEDLEIDMPKFWDYLSECLLHLLCDETLPLSKLHKCLSKIIELGKAPRLLAPLFKCVIEEKGPNFLQSIWHLSNLSFADFMPQSEVDSFINAQGLEFMVGGETPIGLTQLSYEEIQEKLEVFLNTHVSFDDIVNWISANVGNQIKENKFIKVLATVIFENSIVNAKTLNSGILRSHYKLLQKYIDNKPSYELQCLYALQALVHKLEHPKGLLLSIFVQLYEDGILSQDCFIQWENSTDPAEQEGKGVAQKQLVAFLTQLKENEDEESSSEDA